MKKKFALPLIVFLLILSFTLSSCRLFSSFDMESKDREIKEQKSEEETGTSEEQKETSEQSEEKDIVVNSPLADQVIQSPLIITGEARGTWFFEASFPVKLLDGNNIEIAAHYAQALSDWMTEDFVPFQAEIEFEKPDTATGFLVLERDNPSGLPQYGDELVIPIRFE